MRIHIARLLQVSDEQKPVIYTQILQGTTISSLNYWLEMVFSIGIAILGLIISSPAVVIGAMLISPLMDPIIANGLVLALGDFYLGIKSFICLLMSGWKRRKKIIYMTSSSAPPCKVCSARWVVFLGDF